MSEVFSGWKRKVGVLTLVMACVLAMAWLTCFTNPNLINNQFDRMIPFNSGGVTLFTDGNTISLVKSELVTTTMDVTQATDDSSQPPTLPESNQDASQVDDQSIGGVSLVTVPVQLCHLNLTSIVDIPFWSIVAPLTLISAFLLLTKPRKSTLSKISESANVEEG